MKRRENGLLISLGVYRAICTYNIIPVMILSDKGTQFYNALKNSKGERPLSYYEQELERLGIEFWTSRRNHPQTNGKMEKWFDTMKKSMYRYNSFQEFVEWYNKKRIHHALGYQTPEKVYWEKV